MNDMELNRRKYLRHSARAAIAGSVSMTAMARFSKEMRFEAIVFDAFPIFDPRPIAAVVETMFPGQGTAIMSAWRTRQFEYQWLRALAGQYSDFLSATRDSLVFAARQLNIEMTSDQKDQLMATWMDLQIWQDVPKSIAELRKDGVRLSILSNMTERMLRHGLERAKLSSQFDSVISTDKIRSYKPDPRAYRLALDTLGLSHDKILFVPFASWDAAGAKWFGLPTFWVNRTGAPAEELGIEPDGMGPDLASLVRFVAGS